MSYALKDVATEVAAKVAYLQEHNGATIHKQWLIASVMQDHERIEGDDKDFAVCCVRFTVEQNVDRYFRTVKQAEEDQTEQLILPGYERLQKRYICDRDGEQVIVRVGDMTDDEIDVKAKQHRQMGDGHYQHAEELLRFKKERVQPVLAVGE